MAESRIEEQVRYNIKLDSQGAESSAVKWTFMIIGTLSRVEATKNEIYSQFEKVAPSGAPYRIHVDSFKNWYCDFFSFSTSAGRIEQPERIHLRLNLDENLAEGNDVYYEQFLQNILKRRRRK